MSKPATLPTFAVDAAYTGGAEAGTPTKVAWTSGRKQEGLEPGSHQLSAQALNEHFNLIGAWIEYLCSPRARHLSPHLAILRTGAAFTRGDDYIQFPAATSTVYIPLTLIEGERITSITARVQDSGSDAITMKLYKADLTGAGTSVLTQIGATQTSSGSAGLHETLTLSGLTELVAATHLQYYVEFVKTGTTSGGFLTSVLLTTECLP